MILGIMSDSHDHLNAIDRALRVFREHDIDMLIHLGDVISPFAYAKILEFPAKIITILGNNDGDILQLKEMAIKGGAVLKQFTHTINVANKRIFLMHGYGSKDQTRCFAEAMALTGLYDIILYGHTHEVEVVRKDDLLILNPGEVCGYLTERHTVAIINLDKMTYEIIDI